MKIVWEGGPKTKRYSRDGRWMIQTERVRGEPTYHYLIEIGVPAPGGWGAVPNFKFETNKIAKGFDPPNLREGTVSYAKALAQFIVDEENK